MSDIDDLCQIILSGIGRSFDHLAEEIIAAGFHRDRTITTAEELDALPVHSLIHVGRDTMYWRSDEPLRPWVPCTFQQRTYSSALFFEPWFTSGPVTVLYEGGRDE